ncbi:MAG: hypothetical protein RLO21_18950 [Nitratireductor sp.]
MFEPGKTYTITMVDGRGTGESTHKVIAVDGPLIKLDRGFDARGGELIVNTTSAHFVSARPWSDEAVAAAAEGLEDIVGSLSSLVSDDRSQT